MIEKIEKIREVFERNGIPVSVSTSNDDLIFIKLTKRLPDEYFAKYVEIAKKLGLRFDSASKSWYGSLKAVSLEKNVVGRFWKSYYYFPDKVPESAVKSVACFKVSKWRRLSCDEYCEERCEGHEVCVERCVERCEEEGWKKVEQVEEEVCLGKRTERGDWYVLRGLAPGIAKAGGWSLPRFADLAEPDERYFATLRDYQVAVFKSVYRSLSECGGATVMMATGAGKSYMAGALAKWLEDQGYRVFMIALQKDLVLQLRQFAQQFGANPVAVTVQTLWRHLKKDEKVENGDDEDIEIYKEYADEYSSLPVDELIRAYLSEKVAVIVDESHHVPASIVKTVLSKAGDGWGLRIGLSATPFRNDGRDLEIYGYSGPIVEPRITSSFLIQHGFAVPVEIYVTAAPKCRGVLEVEEKGSSAYAKIRKILSECESRNRYIAELASKIEKPFIVITQLVKHAELLGKLLAGAGLKVEVATGAVKGELRMQIYNKVKSGELDGIVATTLADEGLDIPQLRSAIIAIGGKSKTRVMQRIGRLVRPTPGKDKAVAYDLADDAPYFANHAVERINLYKTEPAWKVNVDKEVFSFRFLD